MFACSGKAAQEIANKLEDNGWTFNGSYGSHVSNGKEFYGYGYRSPTRLSHVVGFDFTKFSNGDVRAKVHSLPYDYMPEHMKAENAA
jgi:hypothetical protein